MSKRIAAAGGLDAASSDQKAAANRLMKNQEDIGNATAPRRTLYDDRAAHCNQQHRGDR